MTRFVDSIHILPKAADGRALFSVLRGILTEQGGHFATETDVLFHDAAGVEKEPETCLDEGEAFDKILSWPALGGVEYILWGQRILIFFYTLEPAQVDIVTLSINSTPCILDEKVYQKFISLTQNLHVVLKARRTICDYELLSPASWLGEERERIRNGIFIGHYSLDMRENG